MLTVSSMLHRMHCIDADCATVTDVARLSVRLSVCCLCVGYTGVLWKTAESIRMPFGGDWLTCPNEPCFRWRLRFHGKAQFWGCAAHWKALVVSAASISYIVIAILNNGITGRLLRLHLLSNFFIVKKSNDYTFVTLKSWRNSNVFIKSVEQLSCITCMQSRFSTNVSRYLGNDKTIQ